MSGIRYDHGLGIQWPEPEINMAKARRMVTPGAYVYERQLFGKWRRWRVKEVYSNLFTVTREAGGKTIEESFPYWAIICGEVVTDAFD